MTSPFGNENATRQGGALKTYDTETIAQDGETVQEFAYRHFVTSRTVWRWIAAGKLMVRRTPGGAPRIQGVKP